MIDKHANPTNNGFQEKELTEDELYVTDYYRNDL